MKDLKKKIITVLSSSPKPLMAKEIAKAIGGIDKTKINPILYAYPDEFSKNSSHEWSYALAHKPSIEPPTKTPPADQKIEKELLERLRKIYGSTAKFQPGQKEAIVDLLNGKKTIVIQKTGWGKSLVYLMTAKILRDNGKGPAIIISPLLSLMDDQAKKDEVSKQKLKIRFINTPNKDHWDEIYDEIRNNEIDVIMIAPEKLDNVKFLKEIESIIPKVSLFVIDEAHCISDWGHDFRPDYMRILKFTKKLAKGTPILATTATANRRVLSDIKEQIGEGAVVRRGELERKNFYIDILDIGTESAKKEWLVKTLPKLYQKNRGIVYCLTRRACKAVTEYLQSHNINAEMYHARLSDDEKKEIADKFKQKKIDVLVATIAFGMGIDNKEISFVVHYHKPANFVDYYQQIGRAGRNDKVVKCAYAIMLMGTKDDTINRRFIDNAFPSEYDMNRVLRYIELHPKKGLKEIAYAIPFPKNSKHDETEADEERIKQILSLLSVDEAISKNSQGKYVRTSTPWTYNAKDINFRREQRLTELKEFNEFTKSSNCYMRQIRTALGESTSETCGRCANCQGHHFFE